MLSEEKLDVIHIFVFLKLSPLSSSVKIFSFISNFVHFEYVIPSNRFWVFIQFGVLWAPWICGLASDTEFREILSHYCFQYFLSSFFLSVPGIPITCVTPFVVVQQFLGKLFCFSVFFFNVCWSLWKFLLSYLQALRFFRQPCQASKWAHQSRSSFPLVFSITLIFSFNSFLEFSSLSFFFLSF